MNNYLERTYQLRTSDFDMRNRIFPAAILDLFQDVAGMHASSLGIGYTQLKEKNMCWMLSRVGYKVIKQPELFSDVVVKTWPIKSSRIEFDRDYAIYSVNGELLVVGSSQWVILDITHRDQPKIVPARGFDMNIDEYITERSMEKSFPRFTPNFETDSDPYPVKSAYTDIDTNGHVNNIKYSNFVLNALHLPPEAEIVSFRLDYIKEIMDNDTVSITHKSEDGSYLCKGTSPDGSVTHFISRVDIKM